MRLFRTPLLGLLAFLCLSALVAIGGARSVSADVPQSIVLVAGNVWDGKADAPLGPMEILVQNGKIVAMGKKVDRPRGARIVDLSKHTVTPGFIDSHVHLTMRPDMVGVIWSVSPAEKTVLGVQALRLLLDHGFTTVRDLADMDLHGYTTVALKRAVDRGLVPGPRVLVAPHLVSSRGGHGDGMPMIAADTAVSQCNLADGPDEIRRVVRTEISRGAQWIKFGGTGGFSSPSDDPSQVPYSQEEMNVLVETARNQGIPVTTHAYGDEGIRRAANAGVRAIEHANMASPDTLKMVAAKGIYIVPTQIAVVRQARLIDDDAFWAANNDASYVRPKVRKYAKAIMDSTRNLAASNVKIVFGTDVGTFSFDENNAGEFAEMVANGMSIPRALRAGTSVAAEMLMQDDIGVLAVGKTADIVAMPGDPFKDIRVTEKVDFVMKDGKVWRTP